ncbi:flavodoxin [Streptomyces mashuensis]|uniref:Flavodoxin n=1 Tax=Streptomyces mashuensis TaxID=33904 RepID=A0A919ECX2_9ACTN|nr:NAD(P)H-dependent oxidoreductase [Streptomyces mashuensis]GHF39849.1 flavodoxin [Streptomyces mashuensis]
MARSFLFLLGSAREGGNTELLARAAAEQLPEGTEQTWLRLSELRLDDFRDARHGGAWSAGADEELLRETTLAATDVVIASPLYWYSLSASAKRYLDHWVTWLSAPELRFKETMAGRTLWGVTALAHEHEVVAEPLVLTLNHSAAYMGMRFGGVLLGNGSKPGDVLQDAQALARAKTFFAEEAPLAAYPAGAI